MKNKLSVGLKDLNKQIRLVDKMTEAFSKEEALYKKIRVMSVAKYAGRQANLLDGLANFLSELNAQVESAGAVVVCNGED